MTAGVEWQKLGLLLSHTYNEGDAIEIVRKIYEEYSLLLKQLDSKLNEEKLRIEMGTLF